jgi:hypothetical protein
VQVRSSMTKMIHFAEDLLDEKTKHCLHHGIETILLFPVKSILYTFVFLEKCRSKICCPNKEDHSHLGGTLDMYKTLMDEGPNGQKMIIKGKSILQVDGI